MPTRPSQRLPPVSAPTSHVHSACRHLARRRATRKESAGGRALPRQRHPARAEKLDQENGGKPANRDDQESANELDRANAVGACPNVPMRNCAFHQALSSFRVASHVSPAEIPVRWTRDDLHPVGRDKSSGFAPRVLGMSRLPLQHAAILHGRTGVLRMQDLLASSPPKVKSHSAL